MLFLWRVVLSPCRCPFKTLHMVKEKMTVHKALAELKLLDNKIEKQINVFEVAGYKQNGRKINGLWDENEFTKKVAGGHQSITDLIERKAKIKKAIVLSNSVAMVEIGGKKMTVGEAIIQKDILSLKEMLLDRIKENFSNVQGTINKNNEKVQETGLINAQKMLERPYDEKVLPTDEDVKNIMDPFIKRHTFSLVDPIGAQAEIKKLEGEIEMFNISIDAVLSESNALTFIEI